MSEQTERKIQVHGFGAVAVFPVGQTLSDRERGILLDCREAGALPVICAPEGMDEATADQVYGPQLTGSAWRVIAGENAEQSLIALRDREHLGAVLKVRGDIVESLPAPGRKPADYLRTAGRLLRTPQLQRTVDAARLAVPGDKELCRLGKACREATHEGRKRLLLVSQMAAFDKGSCAYWQRLRQSIPEVDVLHITETPSLPERVLREKLKDVTFRPEYAAFPLGLPKQVSGEVPGETRDLAPAWVASAAENLTARFPALGQQGSWAMALYLNALYDIALQTYQPDLTVMWNAFTASHMILDGLCRSRGIPVMYMEFGVLSGTFGFDTRGQMGASGLAHETPAVMPEDALLQADQVISFLGGSGMNRNAQHGGKPGSEVHLHAQVGRVITLIGQNDYESGICPWDGTAKAEHSPRYPDSMAMVRDVAAACGRLGWTCVYRPHPAMKLDPATLPDNVIPAVGGDLFSLLRRSDLTVTLMSQVAYEALLRGHNTLLLGRNQLSGKGAVWEAEAGEEIDTVLRRAAEGGLTAEMRTAFRQHVAHVIRDYTYDSMTERALRYGRTPEQWAEWVRGLLQGE